MRTCMLTGASGRLGSDFIARYSSTYQIAAVTRRRDVSLVGAAVTIRADLSRHAEVTEAVHTAISAIGPIDLVVNAAAIYGHQIAEGFDKVLIVNVAAPAWLTEAVTNRCWINRSGSVPRPSVINVSSTCGHIAYAEWGSSAYPASKAALNMLTIGMADQLAPLGVRVNALAPNSFPMLVSTAHVTNTIVELDRGEDTGRIRVLDVDGDYWLDET